jgi:heme o synthase
MRLFHLSNTYLTGLFVAVAVDSAFGWPAFGWPF